MEELRTKNLLFVCFDSLGTAYQAAQKATGDIDIMEIFPLGPKGHVAFFSEESLKKFTAELEAEPKTQIVYLKLIEQCAVPVLKAYFSVDNASLEQSLLILESSFIGDLAAAANEAVAADLRIVDLRLLRGSGFSATLFLTGTDEKVKSFSQQVSGIKSNIISKPSEKIRNFFAIQP